MHFEQTVDGELWSVTYSKAIADDGTLLFPERLSKEFLDRQRRFQGSYIFSNQYQNEIIPSDEQDFKKEWLKYYQELPKRKHTFAFLDPAISLEDSACFTAFVVVDVDEADQWYLRAARRVRITATQTIKLIFDIYEIYKCQSIGIETVAYQQALMHFLASEMKRRQKFLPVTAVRRGPDITKSTRIRGLQPRFEWQGILVKPGLTEFEDEYLKFPRGTFVDILDALSSIEEIAFAPGKEPKPLRAPNPNSKEYESYVIKNLLNKETGE